MSPHGPIPEKVGRFRLIEEIGRGGLGVVYKAEDTELHAPVAIKFLTRLGERGQRDLLREARNAALLRDHPCIVPIFEVSTSGPVPYIVMQYCEGPTLFDIVLGIYRNGGAMPVEEAALYSTHVASGLAEAHRRGVVHRDIKPSNVILAKDQVKILDFGVSASLTESTTLTADGAIKGTPLYMAPELMRLAISGLGDEQALRYSPRVDVYSLGVTLWEMLHGATPWEDSSSLLDLCRRKEVVLSAADLPKPRPGLQLDVLETVARFVLADPARRCHDGEAALALLKNIAPGATEPPAEAAPRIEGLLESYEFEGGAIRIYMGDITDLEADVIVSSDDTHVSMRGGVSSRIFYVGGSIIQKEAWQQLGKSMGDVIVTTGGGLRCTFVFHALTLDFFNVQETSVEVIRRCTEKVMAIANKLSLRSIAFPALGTGVARLDLKDVTRVMLEVILSQLTGSDGTVREVLLAFREEDVFAAYVRSQVLDLAPGQVTVRRARAS